MVLPLSHSATMLLLHPCLTPQPWYSPCHLCLPYLPCLPCLDVLPWSRHVVDSSVGAVCDMIPKDLQVAMMSAHVVMVFQFLTFLKTNASKEQQEVWLGKAQVNSPQTLPLSEQRTHLTEAAATTSE